MVPFYRLATIALIQNLTFRIADDTASDTDSSRVHYQQWPQHAGNNVTVSMN